MAEHSNTPAWPLLWLANHKHLQTTSTKPHWLASNYEQGHGVGIKGGVFECSVILVPFFTDYVRTLTESFDSKLADVGNHYSGNSADKYADRGLTLVAWRTIYERPGSTGHSKPQKNSRQFDLTNRAQRCSVRRLSDSLTEVSHDFSPAVRWMLRYSAKKGHGPSRLSPQFRQGGFVKVSFHSRLILALDCARLGSKPRQISNQRKPPQIKKVTCCLSTSPWYALV